MNPPGVVYCETTLNYARGEEQQAVPVRILNARESTGELPYETCGFTLLAHETAVSDWYDEEEVRRTHCSEVARLALEFTGCDQAVPYEPLVRSPATAASVADYAPIEFVHSDYTDDYRDMVQDPSRTYGDFITPLLAQHGLSHASLQQASRIAIVQFWRNIGDPKPDYPLALCDARTTPRSMLGTLLVEEYGGVKLEFETFFAFVPDDPASNAWYTFPALSSDEVITFRTYDSQCVEEDRPFWTLHSAFRDPTAGPDAPQRESVEMRVLCLWD